MGFAKQASSIGALADDSRRALYEYVTAQRDAVSRGTAATDVGLRAHTAKFHLDKLVDEGLLDVEYRRLTGRTGPGAGRPAKLYKRAELEFAVSLPERHYYFVGHILAGAIERAQNGEDPNESVYAAAHKNGHRTGQTAEVSGSQTQRMDQALAPYGYEPRHVDDGLILNNCPFDALAREHTDLVCTANHAYVQGVADGLDCDGVCARLEPAQDRCCVTIRPYE